MSQAGAYLFVETSSFSRKREQLFDGDEDFGSLQRALLSEPTRGTVIPGTGSLRKLRWVNKSRGKGKRSGLRVIYLYFEEFGRLYLITVYSKDESDDLSADDKRLFKELSQQIEAELRTNKKKGQAPP